jgi:ubiquinol-cytochrome c reductase cytochrome c subunit
MACGLLSTVVRNGDGMRAWVPAGHRTFTTFAVAFAVFAWVAYFAVLACLLPAPVQGAPLQISSLSAGRQLHSFAPSGAETYTTNCAPCHGNDGEGSDIAPSVKAAGFPELVEPKVTEGGGGMPVFADLLDEQQIRDVSEYVAQSIADPMTHDATNGEGSDVWRLYCTPCHGATGRGGALTGEENAPTLGDVLGADVLVDVIEGPEEMPVFAGSALNERQQTAVALYVQNVIADPPSPGGWGLGYLGPVPEGFFALFLGVASLVLLARWSQGSRRHGDA